MISSYTRYASFSSFRFRSGGAAACPSKGEGSGERIGMEWVLCVSVFDFSFFDLELSSQVQQRIEENLKRGLPAEAFARSTVEFGNEGCYLSLAEVLHINRLGTVFTD